ncbi:MAG: molybdate ABC transporter substrate-binding protein [Gemmatimonadetes bacterium]|nr:molybdate ABC transporter substrate-binding protein [Gemmatimonadota bacterium]
MVQLSWSRAPVRRRRPRIRCGLLAGVGGAMLACGGADSGPVPVQVAVAANFAATADTLASLFERETGTPVSLAVASTGSLYAQIVNGAPHHVFLSADEDRPRRLEEAGLAVPGTRFVYALGQLVAFAPARDDDWTLPAALREPGVRLAWADPRIAPYGAAARAALDHWRIVASDGAVGESVGHVLQYVRTGAVDVAFVSRAQVIDADGAHVRAVPAEVADPIRQAALLLEPGRNTPEAAEFLRFLQSAGARSVIEAAGYELAPGVPADPSPAVGVGGG